MLSSQLLDHTNLDLQKYREEAEITDHGFTYTDDDMVTFRAQGITQVLENIVTMTINNVPLFPMTTRKERVKQAIQDSLGIMKDFIVFE